MSTLGEVGRHLCLPARHRTGGVDLELEPRGHVRLDVGHVPVELLVPAAHLVDRAVLGAQQRVVDPGLVQPDLDRKSTRLNSSHTVISYAVFCLKKKKESYRLYE